MLVRLMLMVIIIAAMDDADEDAADVGDDADVMCANCVHSADVSYS